MATASAARTLAAAIWDKAAGPAWEAQNGMTSAIQTRLNQLVGQGFRLRQASGYSVGNQDFYAALWDKSPGPAWEAHHGMTSAAYQARFNQLVGQGFRLRQVKPATRLATRTSTPPSGINPRGLRGKRITA